MGIFDNVHPGSWSIGGYSLPDFGVTEAFASDLDPVTGGSQIFSGGTTEQLPEFSSYDDPNSFQTYDNTSNTQPTGDVLGDTAPTQTSDPSAPSQPSWEDQQRDSINSGWDSFIGGLDNQLAIMQGAVGGLTETAQSQFGAAKGDLGLQQSQGIQDLANEQVDVKDQQAKTLRDLSENIRNSMRAGSNYLGSLGAGDSSAANQYAYALAKQGTRERSNVQQGTAKILNNIKQRTGNVKEIYNNELNKLTSQRDNNIRSIEQWFAEAQAQVASQKGTAGLNRSRDIQALSSQILNTAISAINSATTDMTSQQKKLQDWATSITSQLTGSAEQVLAQSGYEGNVPGTNLASNINTGTSAGISPTSGGGLFDDENPPSIGSSINYQA